MTCEVAMNLARHSLQLHAEKPADISVLGNMLSDVSGTPLALMNDLGNNYRLGGNHYRSTRSAGPCVINGIDVGLKEWTTELNEIDATEGVPPQWLRYKSRHYGLC